MQAGDLSYYRSTIKAQLIPNVIKDALYVGYPRAGVMENMENAMNK